MTFFCYNSVEKDVRVMSLFLMSYHHVSVIQTSMTFFSVTQKMTFCNIFWWYFLKMLIQWKSMLCWTPLTETYSFLVFNIIMYFRLSNSTSSLSIASAFREMVIKLSGLEATYNLSGAQLENIFQDKVWLVCNCSVFSEKNNETFKFLRNNRLSHYIINHV